MDKWYVYIVNCSKDNSLYTGITKDLDKRIKQHNNGTGAKYTRNRGIITLIKSYLCQSKSEALKLEARIKKLPKEEKLAFLSDISKTNSQEIHMTKPNFTSINVILDASGSMGHLIHDTLGSFNSFLDEQKAIPDEAIFTLSSFNDEHKIIIDGVKLHNVPVLTKKHYIPRGGTALLDAMGHTINSVGQKLAALPEEERPSKVIFLIITDGRENASTKFSYDEIRSMVRHQEEKYNWKFIFLGANIDAVAEGTSLGVSANNTINYSATSVGTRSLYSFVSHNLTNYRTAQPDKLGSINFFDPDLKQQLDDNVERVKSAGTKFKVGRSLKRYDQRDSSGRFIKKS